MACVILSWVAGLLVKDVIDVQLQRRRKARKLRAELDAMRETAEDLSQMTERIRKAMDEAKEE